MEFKVGDKVRVNEGLLEGQTGVVTEVAPNRTSVKLDGFILAAGTLAFFDDVLVPASEPHPALAHLKSLYPDFLKSDSYFYRLTTDVDGLEYVSLFMNAARLQEVLRKYPAGLVKVEFMIKNDDPNRGLAWKVLWSD